MKIRIFGHSFNGHLISYSVAVRHRQTTNIIPFSILLTGDFLQRTSSLNRQLCSAVLSQADTFKCPASESNPFGTFDYLSLYHPEEHTAVMELLEAVKKGVCVCVCSC